MKLRPLAIHWQPSSQANPLQIGEIHLWVISLEKSEQRISENRQVLSLEELQAFDRLIDPQKASRRIAARGGLRRILEGYTGVPANRLSIQQLPGGKPALDDNQNPLFIQFNLSHSSSLAAAVFCRNRRVGIDIEQIVPIETIQHIQGALIDTGSIQSDAYSLLEAWTRREATLKVWGTGWRGAVLSDDENYCSTMNFYPSEGFIGGLAVEGDISQDDIFGYRST